MMTLYLRLGRWLRPIARRLVVFSAPRARILVLNQQRQVLLVRNWLSQEQWALPGGGRHWRESFADAASRELREETGLNIAANQLQPLGRFTSDEFNKPLIVECFQGSVSGQPAVAASSFEIVEARWFNLDALPARRSKTVNFCLEQLL